MGILQKFNKRLTYEHDSVSKSMRELILDRTAGKDLSLKNRLLFFTHHFEKGVDNTGVKLRSGRFFDYIYRRVFSKCLMVWPIAD